MKRVIVFLLLMSVTLFNACSKTVKPKADNTPTPAEKPATADDASVKSQDYTMEQTPKNPSPTPIPHPITTKEVTTESSQSYDTESSEPTTIMYKATLGPFFTVSAYVPYKVKVSFERHIFDVRSKITDDSQLKIHVTSYYPKGNKRQKLFAGKRANNLVYYAKWKEKMSADHFIIKVLPSTDKSKQYRIIFDIAIPSSVKMKKKKTVYYSDTKTVDSTNPTDPNTGNAVEQTDNAGASSSQINTDSSSANTGVSDDTVSNPPSKGDEDLVMNNGNNKDKKQDQVDEAYITNEKNAKPDDLKDPNQTVDESKK